MNLLKWITISKNTVAYGTFKNKNNQDIYFNYELISIYKPGNLFIFQVHKKSFEELLQDLKKYNKYLKIAKEQNNQEDLLFYQEQIEEVVEDIKGWYSMMQMSYPTIKEFLSFLHGGFFQEHVGNDYGKEYQGCKLENLEISSEFFKYIKKDINELNYNLFNSKESISNLRKCDSCSNGYLNLKISKYGEFWGCNQFPNCKSIKNKIE